jgi:hypothetical protein
MFQTKVPVVEPKSTKVTDPLKGGFGRVEDILFGEQRLQVELATYLYKRDRAMYTKHPDKIKKIIVDRSRRVGQKMIRPSARHMPPPAAKSAARRPDAQSQTAA